MTKIGEGKEPAKEPTQAEYHQQVEFNASRFLNALESYKEADSADRVRLKAVMDQTMGLIRSAVREIRYAGINKQEAKVEKDYQTYIANQTPENLTALEEDLGTLRDYNKLS